MASPPCCSRDRYILGRRSACVHTSSSRPSSAAGVGGNGTASAPAASCVPVASIKHQTPLSCPRSTRSNLPVRDENTKIVLFVMPAIIHSSSIAQQVSASRRFGSGSASASSVVSYVRSTRPPRSHSCCTMYARRKYSRSDTLAADAGGGMAPTSAKNERRLRRRLPPSSTSIADTSCLFVALAWFPLLV